jgi:hypothetical protein
VSDQPSSQAGTRLMVFKGNFTRMSIAIYGRHLSTSRTTTGSVHDGSSPKISLLLSYSNCNSLAYANGALGLAKGITPSIGEVFQAIDYPISAAIMTKVASEWPLHASILIEASDVLRSDFGAVSAVRPRKYSANMTFLPVSWPRSGFGHPHRSKDIHHLRNAPCRL